jgi:hypothetical protein
LGERGSVTPYRQIQARVLVYDAGEISRQAIGARRDKHVKMDGMLKQISSHEQQRSPDCLRVEEEQSAVCKMCCLCFL